MKKLFIALCVTLLVGGCFGNYPEDTDYKDIIIVSSLNEVLYMEADQWHPVGTATYTTRVWLEYLDFDEEIKPGRPNRKVIRYKNDTEDLFISFDSVIDQVHTLHKTNHELPLIYGEQVEKVVLTHTSIGEIVLEGEVLHSLLEMLRNYYENRDSVVVNQCSISYDLAGVNIYFKNEFPAYYDNNEIIYVTEKGDFGISQLEGMNSYGCLILPEKVKQYIMDQFAKHGPSMRDTY